jgi:hypothetical protein
MTMATMTSTMADGDSAVTALESPTISPAIPATSTNTINHPDQPLMTFSCNMTRTLQ